MNEKYIDYKKDKNENNLNRLLITMYEEIRGKHHDEEILGFLSENFLKIIDSYKQGKQNFRSYFIFCITLKTKTYYRNKKTYNDKFENIKDIETVTGRIDNAGII